MRIKAQWGPLVDLDLVHEMERLLGGRLAAKQGKKRSYVHAKPKARMDQEGGQRYDANGCKAWYINAEELETKIVDVILAAVAYAESAVRTAKRRM